MSGTALSTATGSLSSNNRAVPVSLLVLGVGNILLSDEGAGVKAVDLFAQRYDLPMAISVLDGGTAGIDLIDAIADYEALIVVDAARLGRVPASIEVWRDPPLTNLLQSRLSPHQIGLGDVFAKLTLLDRMPGRLTLIVIEPSSVDLGLDLSPLMAARLGKLAKMIATECIALGLAVTPQVDEAVTSRPRN